MFEAGERRSPAQHVAEHEHALVADAHVREINYGDGCRALGRHGSSNADHALVAHLPPRPVEGEPGRHFGRFEVLGPPRTDICVPSASPPLAAQGGPPAYAPVEGHTERPVCALNGGRAGARAGSGHPPRRRRSSGDPRRTLPLGSPPFWTGSRRLETNIRETGARTVPRLDLMRCALAQTVAPPRPPRVVHVTDPSASSPTAGPAPADLARSAARSTWARWCMHARAGAPCAERVSITSTDCGGGGLQLAAFGPHVPGPGPRALAERLPGLVERLVRG